MGEHACHDAKGGSDRLAYPVPTALGFAEHACAHEQLHAVEILLLLVLELPAIGVDGAIVVALIELAPEVQRAFTDNFLHLSLLP